MERQPLWGTNRNRIPNVWRAAPPNLSPVLSLLTSNQKPCSNHILCRQLNQNFYKALTSSWVSWESNGYGTQVSSAGPQVGAKFHYHCKSVVIGNQKNPSTEVHELSLTMGHQSSFLEKK